MKGLKIFIGAPLLLLGLWLVQLAVGVVAAMPVAAATKAALGGFTWLDDGHRLGALLELVAENPTVATVLVYAIVGSVVGGLFLWTLAGGAIFARLGGTTRGAETLAAAGRFALPMFVQGLYALIIRGVLVGIGAGMMAAWEPLLPVLPVLYVLGVLAHDHARAAVVLTDARPYHPMTALQGLTAAFRRPGMWLGGLALVLLQLGASAMLIYLGLTEAFGGATPSVLRLMALVPLALSLWRIAAVVVRFRPDWRSAQPGVPQFRPDTDTGALQSGRALETT